ncbi:MAG: glycosyl hydrolase 115 family protein [Prevotella sp.]|nr:glycosyl hydrolase 115 family protein [Prevotella sp.]
MRKAILTLTLICVVIVNAADSFVSFQKGNEVLTIAQNGQVSNIVYDANDDEGIRMAVKNLQADIKAVTGIAPALSTQLSATDMPCIIIGSLNSQHIQQIMKKGKMTKKELEGKTEKYLLQTVALPTEGVNEALVIAGSDKRGTIYGIYELSRQIGVSPWYWFADVPIAHHDNIYIKRGTYTDGEPKVAYRGIFINDEWPSFGNWANSKFGGINSKCYQHIFELLLRLKANYMWPAMWGSAFYDDDPENGILANKMGIIMGTSHHEPMALAQQDWKRRKGHGKWSFVNNHDEMIDFWRGGVERARNWETMYTVGMRGDGDEAMEDKATVELMEQIVREQRQLLEKVTGKKAADIPQVWALYKEVQDFYDQGMKVPDDITLLLCDDNWGNIRRVPAPNAPKHKGGYGMYYHVDYVGGPRNSKWINVSPIPRVWEQMNLAYQYGVNKMWILNVGDLKPMEYPIQFFLDMAWNPDQFNPQNLSKHSVEFCRSIFGDQYAEEAARLLRTYAKFNRRVTPELLNMRTYSVINYNEWARVTGEYDQLALDADALGSKLPQNMQDAWFQLIGYPIKAMANLYDMYYAQAMNQRLAKKNDPMANGWAKRVEECFKKDAALAVQYHQMNGGKWNHMMDEQYIGYKSWKAPDKKIMPEVKRVDGNATAAITLPTPAYITYQQPKGTPTFVAKDGYVSIEAEHFTRKTDGKQAQWTVIPELGRTLSAITPQPVTASVEGMAVEYDMEIPADATARVLLRFAPTLNFNGTGLRYAVSFDGGEEQVVNINGEYKGESGNQWQREHAIDSQTIHALKAGKHALRIRPLDNGLVLQKILINLGGLHKSYLGPDETLKN